MTPPIESPQLQPRPTLNTADPTVAVEPAATHGIVELALLPLVRVAWEDGGVDDLEKAEILAAAERLLGTTPGRLVDNWLADRPSWTEQDTALRELAQAHNAGDPLVTDAFLAQVVTECENVARASGSALGEAYRIDAREQAVIDDIVEGLTSHLEPAGQTSWSALLDELDSPSHKRSA